MPFDKTYISRQNVVVGSRYLEAIVQGNENLSDLTGIVMGLNNEKCDFALTLKVWRSEIWRLIHTYYIFTIIVLQIDGVSHRAFYLTRDLKCY